MQPDLSILLRGDNRNVLEPGLTKKNYSELRKRIHGSPMRARLLRNQGAPPVRSAS